MTKEEEQVLRDFLIDSSCLNKLDEWTKDCNLFEILGITNTEIRHSNILAWLFNPNENHGLGDTFIKNFFNKIVGKYYEKDSKAFELLLQNFNSYNVLRESNHMDIVLDSYDEKTAVIIENKIWAGESTNQLHDYYEKSKFEYKGYKNLIYIFLTPDGREAKKEEDKKIWKPFSYDEIIEILDDSTSEKQLKPESKLLIENYKSIIRENIMNEKDPQLVNLCTEIYNKHSAALKLIFENVKIDKSLDNEIICSTLKELSNNGKIIYYDDNTWDFFTKAMDEYLPKLKDTSSSWGTDWIYYYWFSGNEEKLKLHFELGGRNVSKEIMQKMEKIIEASKKSKKEGFKYCRTFLAVETLNSDNYEESLKQAVINLVNKALQYEKEVLKIVSNK